jgi:hypothetical protein
MKVSITKQGGMRIEAEAGELSENNFLLGLGRSECGAVVEFRCAICNKSFLLSGCGERCSCAEPQVVAEISPWVF